MTTAAATAPVRAPQKPRRRRVHWRKRIAPWILLAPSIAILIIGMGYPLIWQLVTSFQDYGLAQQFGQPADFVGLSNYIDFLTTPTTLGVIGRSLLFCLVTAVVTIIIGLLLAVLLSAVGSVARITLQIALLLAWATPVAASMTVWTWLFDRRNGMVNYLLNNVLHLNVGYLDWLADPTTFYIVAMVIVVWMSVPFVAFSLYAGLTQVSEEVLEAAQLDGASAFQRLRFILLPMVRPVLRLVLLLNLIWDLRVFTQIRMLQDSGGQTTDFDLLGTYIYRIGTGAQAFGMAAAVSVFVLVLTLVVAAPYVRLLLKEDDE